jgi:hypothetical protein
MAGLLEDGELLRSERASFALAQQPLAKFRRQGVVGGLKARINDDRSLSESVNN